MIIKVKKLFNDVDLPLQCSKNIYDIWMYDEEIDESNKTITYRTGLTFDIPEGFIGLVIPRFRMTTMHAQMANGIGIIQPNSSNTELLIRCTINHAHFKYEEIVEENRMQCVGLESFRKPSKPARIAQLIVIPITDITLLSEDI